MEERDAKEKNKQSKKLDTQQAASDEPPKEYEKML